MIILILQVISIQTLFFPLSKTFYPFMDSTSGYLLQFTKGNDIIFFGTVGEQKTISINADRGIQDYNLTISVYYL